MNYFAILDLLSFQFNGQFKDICDFCDTIINVSYKVNGKKNSVWVHGNVSAGKIFLFDAVAAFYLNVGYISNLIRLTIFAFMDCCDRRVILWHEAQCDAYFYEEVKAILSSPKVNVKNLGPKVVNKTPVIILSNRKPFPDTSEFNARMVKYNWRTCDTLQQWGNKKPHPLFTLELFMYLSNSDSEALLYIEIIDIIHNTINTVLNINLDE